MKTTMINIRSIFNVAIIALAFASCSSDDNFIDPSTNPSGNANLELAGILNSSISLDGTKEYTLTGTYTVKSGNTLTIPAGTKIISNKGTEFYIVVEKGADINIQGTAASPVVMTSVDGAPGDWGGLVILGNGVTTAGVDAVAEVGGLIYGGTDNTDNSGSINYLIIKGAGAQINTESQYNGLTLYAVGSGTSIQNVALIDGADDGIEFFGGAVNITNLYLENNEDDAIDWTEGWKGTVTNSYILHTISGFSTAVEADGINNNPSLINLTAVSETGGTALQFKKESGATITGLSLTAYDTSIDMRDHGPLANVQIEGEDADPALSYNSVTSVSKNSFNWVNTNVATTRVALSGSISSEVVLDPAINYDLIGAYIVEEGGKLIIPAGTKISARNGGTEVYIAVLKGGQIDIQGTENNPVVMSSTDAKPGDWGGLTICGNATTTAGIDAIAEVGGFIYGGLDDTDNSGSIRNLVILGTGAQINADSQYNGISLYAVGSNTTIENIAVINGADDGVEFFGGTVNAINIYLQDNEDDAIDWTEGWNGSITNTYVKHDNVGFSTAIEADGVNNNPSIVNFTAVSSTGGTALQFKKTSGATINNISLSGYTTHVDMKDSGPVSNIIVDGSPLVSTSDDVFNGTAVNIESWTWISARL